MVPCSLELMPDSGTAHILIAAGAALVIFLAA
jgi:hypothetical protein